MKWTLFLILGLTGCVQPTAPTRVTVVTNTPTPLVEAMPLARQGNYTAKLWWTPPPVIHSQSQAKSYLVGFGQSTNYTTVTSTTATNLTVPGLSYNTLYYFAVRSVDYASQLSDWSPPVRLSVKQGGKPQAPLQ